MCGPRKAKRDRAVSRRNRSCPCRCSRPEAEPAEGARKESVPTWRAQQAREIRDNSFKAGDGIAQLRNRTLEFAIKFCGQNKPAETNDPCMSQESQIKGCLERTLQGEAERHTRVGGLGAECVPPAPGLFLCFLLLLLGLARTLQQTYDPSTLT